MILKSIISGVLPLCLSSLPVYVKGQNMVVISPQDTPSSIISKAANVVPSLRQYLWQRQELTAFIHFGMNTFTNKEWGDGKDSPSLFCPTEIDAEQWVKTLRDAGFKSVILTCKHHDGFCLWPSAYTDYSVKSSPWKQGKGDVVREVSNACKKYGVGFGVYLSPWDRNSLLYGQGKAYNDYFIKQLEELLTQYGHVSEVWFDGANGEGPNGKKQKYDFVRWYKLIRKLQPQAVIAVMGPDVRWVGTETGRGRETEWSVVPKDNLDPTLIAKHSQQTELLPPEGDMVGDDIGSRSKILKAKVLAWYPAEIDVSIRPGWFYHKAEDNKVKSSKELTDIYFSSVGRNGVLLLNIPPNKEGRLSAEDVKSLKSFKENIDNIFKTNLLTKYINKNRVKTFKALKPSIDGRYETSSVLADNENKAKNKVLTYYLKSPITFNVCALQEDISKGQRVESFIVEARRVGGSWEKVAEGTTIGYKRLLRFNTVTAQEIRLVIKQARGKVYLSEFGLYME